jgi:paraquat-inducible protein B
LRQDVRGLEPGAPVDFRGIRIGEVSDVTAILDPANFDFSVRVMLSVDAERLGVQIGQLDPNLDREVQRKNLLDGLVKNGVRAQIRSGSLLTGALYVALDYFPDAPPATLDWSQQPVQIPTIPGTIAQLENQVANIVKKIDELPLKEIGNDLKKAIEDLDAVLVSAHGTLDDTNALLAPNSVLIQQLESTLQEVSNAARSLRVLTDYLERQPESLIRGKSGGPK